MFGFILGTACLVGLIGTLRRRHRWAHAYGGFRGFGHGCGPSHGYGGFHGYGDASEGGPPGAPWQGLGGEGFGRRDGGFGRGGFVGFGRERFGPGAFLARLGLREDQERPVRDALSDLFDRTRALRKPLRSAREQIAKAVRGESLDEVALGEAQATVEDVTEQARKAFVDALAKVHGVLDERQRRILADGLEGGPGAFFGGPWRGAWS